MSGQCVLCENASDAAVCEACDWTWPCFQRIAADVSAECGPIDVGLLCFIGHAGRETSFPIVRVRLKTGRPYYCGICRAVEPNNRATMLRHGKARHDPSRPARQCDHCGVYFDDHRTLNLHKTRCAASIPPAIGADADGDWDMDNEGYGEPQDDVNELDSAPLPDVPHAVDADWEERVIADAVGESEFKFDGVAHRGIDRSGATLPGGIEHWVFEIWDTSDGTRKVWIPPFCHEQPAGAVNDCRIVAKGSLYRFAYHVPSVVSVSFTVFRCETHTGGADSSPAFTVFAPWIARRCIATNPRLVKTHDLYAFGTIGAKRNVMMTGAYYSSIINSYLEFHNLAKVRRVLIATQTADYERRELLRAQANDLGIPMNIFNTTKPRHSSSLERSKAINKYIQRCVQAPSESFLEKVVALWYQGSGYMLWEQEKTEVKRGIQNGRHPCLALRTDTSFYAATFVGYYREKVPVVESLNPHYGPVSGGTTVEVLGRYFTDCLVNVTIGGITCRIVKTAMVREGGMWSVTIVTPELDEPCSRDVVVETKEGGRGVSCVRFTFIEGKVNQPPEIIRNEIEIRGGPTARKVFVPLKAVLLTIMNEDGIIIDTDLVPFDSFSFAAAGIQRVLSFQCEAKRDLVRAVYVDDVRKFKTQIHEAFFKAVKPYMPLLTIETVGGRMTVLQDIFHAMQRIGKALNKRHTDFSMRLKGLREVFAPLNRNFQAGPYRSKKQFVDALTKWLETCKINSKAAFLSSAERISAAAKLAANKPELFDYVLVSDNEDDDIPDAKELAIAPAASEGTQSALAPAPQIGPASELDRKHLPGGETPRHPSAEPAAASAVANDVKHKDKTRKTLAVRVPPRSSTDIPAEAGPPKPERVPKTKRLRQRKEKNQARPRKRPKLQPKANTDKQTSARRKAGKDRKVSKDDADDDDGDAQETENGVENEDRKKTFLVLRPHGFTKARNVMKEPVLSALLDHRKFDWTHGTNILEAWHRRLRPAVGRVRNIALARLRLKIEAIKWNRSKRGVSDTFTASPPNARLPFLALRSIKTTYDELKSEGFQDKKLTDRSWSKEERQLLLTGLADIHKGERVIDTQDQYRWLSHHIMDGRRTAAEVRRALNELLQEQPEWLQVGEDRSVDDE